MIDVESEDGMEYGAVILGPPKSGNSGELEVRFADGVVDDWEIEEFREPVHHLAGGRKWRIGEVIDIDTEDGLEKGATIMGPATGGTSDAPGGSEDDVDEILFQGWLQKKSGATSGGKMSGKKALKNAT